MDRLLSMKVFQRVVDEGGFAAAARALDMSPAGVTRMIAGLEDHLGVRLLQRTTQKLCLHVPAPSLIFWPSSLRRAEAGPDASAFSALAGLARGRLQTDFAARLQTP